MVPTSKFCVVEYPDYNGMDKKMDKKNCKNGTNNESSVCYHT